MVPGSMQPPQSPGQPRGQLPKIKATRGKDGKQLNNSSCRSKRRHPKDSTGLLKNKSRLNEEAEPSSQHGESLRWEGALEDPQAEEKRLELYRANRRQRYISHRKTLLKDNQVVFSMENKDLKVLSQSEQQVSATLLHLRLN
uniref:Uncharacterized protein n=1 Tax=Labrus bergylta TaxID=56723 RepID=A0A3Q3KTX5_9LABR